MPWSETKPMFERLKFIEECFGETPDSMAALCRKYGVSRRTGYKWLRRWNGDESSLQNRSRRPLSHPRQLSAEDVERILVIRRAVPQWGPKKIAWALTQQDPGVRVPALSTVADVLKRHGMISPKKRARSKVSPFSSPFQGCDQPNDVWCTDFKGWFRTGGAKCHPLTLSDAYSRYVLRCVGLTRPRTQPTRRVFERAFSEFGLPIAIRSDNGPPFSSPALGGLSELSVWWMRLGIITERIDPGHPEQNGRHERMHRTLKQHTANPPQRNIRAQQRSFDKFRQFFNDERPHEALGMTTPSSWYEPSPRPMPSSLPKPEYPLGVFTLRVPHNGVIHWRGSPIYLSVCLQGEDVAFTSVGEERWAVIFCQMLLGHIERDHGLSRPHYRLHRAPAARRIEWLEP